MFFSMTFSNRITAAYNVTDRLPTKIMKAYIIYAIRNASFTLDNKFIKNNSKSTWISNNSHYNVYGMNCIQIFYLFYTKPSVY